MLSNPDVETKHFIEEMCTGSVGIRVAIKLELNSGLQGRYFGNTYLVPIHKPGRREGVNLLTLKQASDIGV